MCMSFWMARWSFSTKKKKSLRFDSKTMHAFGLYRTNAKPEGFRYGPIARYPNQSMNSHPDILSLLLP